VNDYPAWLSLFYPELDDAAPVTPLNPGPTPLLN